MDAYVATARIVSVRPQRRAHAAGATAYESRVISDLRADESTADPDVEETLAERWHHIRTGWSQTTFYLFDPQSWR